MMFTPRPKGLGKDNFVKLNDRESLLGIFRGDIYTFKRHWANNKSETCTGAECPICKVDAKNYPSFRFRINFLTDNMLPKIFEGGAETYDALTEVDKSSDLAKCLVQITRRGLSKKTSYEFEAQVKTPITKEARAKIDSIPLLPLS
jgi:hypothetical protein